MAEKKMNRWVAYLVTMVAIVLWGMSYLWSNALIRQGIPVEYFLFLRIILAGIMLLVFNLVMGYSIQVRLADLNMFALLALCEPLVYFFCETYGIKFTESPTYSALIIATTPIFALIAGVVFFHEKMSKMNILGVGICLAGLVFVTWYSSGVGKAFILGALLLLIAVFAEVGQAVYTKVLADRSYAPSVIVMYQFFFGSVYLLPFFLARGVVDFDPALYLSWDVIRPLLCLALLCSSLAFTCWASAVKNLGVARSSIFQAMIPVVTALVGFILGQERLSLLQWTGIFVACIGLVLTQMGSGKAKPGA